MDPQQDNSQQNDLVSEPDDLCTPALMKITKDNIADAFRKHEYLEQLEALESELPDRPATECLPVCYKNQSEKHLENER